MNRIPKNRLRAVVFDYGNTIIEFGAPQIARLDAALTRGLARHYREPDEEKVAAIRFRNRMAPFQGTPPEYRENDLQVITTELIRELYGEEPRNGVVEDLIRVRHEAFLSVLETPEYVFPLLERLGESYRLALLSNYPSGRSIRDGLEKTGLAPYFESVVVSGDIGFCKPHPITFETVLRELGLPPEETVYVGDNWLADVQGAKQAGMWMIHTRQWEPPEPFAAQPNDFQPDAVIHHFTELESLLL